MSCYLTSIQGDIVSLACHNPMFWQRYLITYASDFHNKIRCSHRLVSTGQVLQAKRVARDTDGHATSHAFPLVTFRLPVCRICFLFLLQIVTSVFSLPLSMSAETYLNGARRTTWHSAALRRQYSVDNVGSGTDTHDK